jgi:hypothetical protein
MNHESDKKPEQSEQEALAQALTEQLSALSGQTTTAAKELSEIFRLEMQLTVDDTRRLLITWLAIVPAIILAWISFSGLIAWTIYNVSESVTWAISGVTLLQFSLCATLLSLRKRFRSGIGFRRTKSHARRLVQEVSGEASDSDQPTRSTR